ncbi:MAG: septal ring lytic transglycosylase RlpA family protein [Syntrophales bacterium]|nr:septal ring lytic transglycosylase RlpA family protein [Syntrophales bacterium]MDD4339299.1 septal ring lytic transglycosylase RlpA family protein [Syntrophales bacterium]HPB70332.1 septal ring lytic transglycosylase RlpA family protein [Syntrophales bacterium]HQN26004.1 septal ring lytic transglycosylase RlpA family protein [Syntrophales bacterium]HQP28332.1 septal ring lytic transglycosylase RlpA family protein [Syntrophales bacterium]
MSRTSSMRGLALLAVVGPLMLLSAAPPLRAQESGAAEADRMAPAESATVGEPEEGSVCRAFYYAKRFNGRRTSSGAIYRPERRTAAHPSLPLGTRVRVVNIANDRSVVVTVNDRCRKRSFDVIDLSRAAARELRFLRGGTAWVRVIPLDD